MRLNLINARQELVVKVVEGGPQDAGIYGFLGEHNCLALAIGVDNVEAV